jgi:hypothetical protein
MFSPLMFNRKAMNMTSLSSDGIAAPQVFLTSDVYRGNHGQLDYVASPIVTVDGVPVSEWLQDAAAWQVSNYQDPDAQYNSLFHSIPQGVAGIGATLVHSGFEIADSHTLSFYNGSTLTINNQVQFAANWSAITSAEDFHNVFEVPASEVPVRRRSTDEFDDCEDEEEEQPVPGNDDDEDCDEEEEQPVPGGNDDDEDCDEEEEQPVPGGGDDEDCDEEEEGATRLLAEEDIPDYDIAVGGPVNYPTPWQMNPDGNLATFFLQEDAYKDVAVMSVLSFVGLRGQVQNETKFFEDAKYLAESFVYEARRQGRTKLVLDLSGNTGGFLILAYELYRLLFPAGEFTGLDRMPANDGLAALVAANFTGFWDESYGAMRTPDDKLYENGPEWFGPYAVGAENMTAPFVNDRNVAIEGGEYYDPDFDEEPNSNPPWAPEDIVIVTDGICASACTILTGLLTRNHGIRTVALGGRPFHQPMQVMGGVRGTIVQPYSTIKTWFNNMESSFTRYDNADGAAVFSAYAAAIPREEQPPLLPELAYAGAVNGQNGYAEDDLDGLPFHFQYQAANCRLFYTQRMMADVSETWRRAASVQWHGQPCVHGSTVNDDGTMGDGTVPYSPAVRSTANHIGGPGAL